MSARAVARAVSVPLSWVDLPTLPHPQYISSNGYELAAPEVKVACHGIAENEDQVMVDWQEGGPKAEEGEEAVAAVEEDQGEPLLSMADSLVLVQSLHQTRQRHLQRLLPHIFTHPPLPSHSKPRARGPPRSTFLYPTPPPLQAPLPYREYHGPRPKSSIPSAAETPSADSPKADEPKGSTARTQARAKRAAELDEIAPAHETECIARVTLSIGPFSYPETELWIGRFVEPRADAGKAIKAEKRAKMMAAGLEPVKKKTPAVPRPSAVSPALVSKPTPTQSSNVRPLPSAAGPSVRPGPIPSTPAPAGTAKPESAINPELIRKVNLAAATRPWLSEIIHKAARKQATKEELSRLGRTVGRLNKGEDIDQEGEAVTVAAGVRATSTAPPPNASGSGSAAAGPSRTSSPLTSEDDSDSDLSDPDEVASRKGPPQVGGGPLKRTTSKDVASETVKRETSTAEEGPAEAAKAPAQPTSPRVPTPFTHFTPKPVVPQPRPPKSAIPQRPPPKATTTPSRPPPRPPLPHSIAQSNSADKQNGIPTPLTATMPPPPPPRPLYPNVPPFLFVAFKDASTEKFLLPLGANSVITRIGGDHVTHPAPISISVTSAPTPTEATAPATPAQPVMPAEISLTAVEKAKMRSRASIGRNAKDAVATPSEPKAVTPIPPEPQIPISVDPVPEEKKKITPIRDEKPGTVVVSMLMPMGEWEKPDWDELEKGLPWVNSTPKQTAAPGLTPDDNSVNPDSKVAGAEKSSSTQVTGPSAQKTTTASRPFGSILNLASVDLTPSEGDLRPVTIRLSGIDDLTWTRIKQIMEVVEQAEVDLILREEADLVRSRCADALTPSSTPGANGKNPDVQVPVVPIAPTSSALIQSARSIYVDRKQSRFTRLLRRTPSRTFLRLRTEIVDPALIEATTDKWAPRPYPISTKPLYTRSPPPEDYTDPLPFAHYPSPEKAGNNRKKKGDDTGVTFEMPVSLDKLDEMVEEGAKFAVGKKGAKRVRVKAEKGEEDGRKKRRSIAGAICEGCGLPGLKVWRRGPGGKGTLCKDCGDAFVAGTLGELKAPGAGKKTVAAVDVDRRDPIEVEAGEAEPLAEAGVVKAASPPPGSFGTAEGGRVASVPAGSTIGGGEPLEMGSAPQPPMTEEQAKEASRMDVDLA